MRTFSIILLLLGAQVLAFGQIDSSAITIAATRSIIMPPDQAIFGIDVSSSFTAGLDQVVAPLQGLGITAANLSSVSGSNTAGLLNVGGTGTGGTGIVIGPSSDFLNWFFQLTVPFQKMPTAVAALSALQKTIGQNNSGLSLTFYLSTLQTSVEAQQAQCSQAALIADARAQAQKLADAVGSGVGPILSLSDNGGISIGAAQAPRFSVLASVNSASVLVQTVFNTPMVSSANCSLTVQFKLVRFQQ